MSDWANSNGLYATVTRIDFPDEQAHATGFFFNYKGTTHLVTNEHVLQNEAEIKIFLRDNEVDGGMITQKIDLEKEDTWYTHSHEKVDIAVVPLSKKLSDLEDVGDNVKSLALSTENLPTDNPLIRTGEPTITLGYPITTEKPHYPIARQGVVAEPYLPNQDTLNFKSDARTFDGSSGSPVLTVPSPINLYVGRVSLGSGPTSYLLGIHSEHLWDPSIVDKDKKYLERTDINTTWYSYLLKETIEEI
jgi:S1-C subfamily serine protease